MGTDLQDRIHSTQFPSHDQNRAIVLSLSLRLCPFATVCHCLTISFCSGCVNNRIFLSTVLLSLLSSYSGSMSTVGVYVWNYIIAVSNPTPHPALILCV